MAIDATPILGSRQLAGVKVNPKGMAKRVGRNVAGDLPARIVYGKSDPTKSDTPQFGRLAFLAVGEDELALIKLKSGIVSLKLDEVIARVGRGEIESADLAKGYVPALTITFTSGEIWQMEVPPPNKKQARAVVDALVG